MHAYSLLAPAKINLYLEILGSRPDGYHELAMVLQGIELGDRVELRANGTDRIVVLCDHPGVPADRTNLAYRAAALMAEQFPEAFNRYGGVEITIQKNIPVGAGLAGGSTNAAAVLVGVDLLWKLGLTQSELQEFGALLGSDVPFCLSGGTAIATGRGERLSPLTSLTGLWVVLAKYHSLSVSTPWAYQTYRQQFASTYATDRESLSERRQHVHSKGIVAAVQQQDYQTIGRNLHNDLENVVLPEHPQVATLKQTMQSLSSIGAMMSGSGPTVFALASSQAEAEQIKQQLQDAILDADLGIWITQLSSSGIQIVK